MTGLINFRNAVIEGLKVGTGLLAVEAAEGVIGEAELKRLSVRPPGAFVSVMGIRSMTKVGPEAYRAEVSIGVYLVTSGANRITDATEMMEQITLCASDNTWDLPYTALAEDIEARTMYNADDQRRGLLLMGISWHQVTRLTRPDPATLQARADDKEEAGALGLPTDDSRFPETPLTGEFEEG
jgi:hypothetical protein